MTFVPPINIFWILADALQVLVFLIIVEVIISWAMMMGALGISPYTPWVRTLRKITNPILNPFRRLVPPYKLNGFDISPILAILAINLIMGFLFTAGRPISLIR